MKSLLLPWLCLLLLAVTARRGDPPLTRGSELIGWIEGGMKGTFIVFFYDQDASVHRTQAVRDEVDEKLVMPFENFHYYEVDVMDQDFDLLVEQYELSKTDLRHSPIVMVASDGRAFWAHGVGAVEEVKYRLPKYSVDLQTPDRRIRHYS